MSTETIRLVRTGRRGGEGEEGVWRWGKRGQLYAYRYTVTARMTPALRWAMRAILMFYCS